MRTKSSNKPSVNALVSQFPTVGELARAVVKAGPARKLLLDAVAEASGLPSSVLKPVSGRGLFTIRLAIPTVYCFSLANQEVFSAESRFLEKRNGTSDGVAFKHETSTKSVLAVTGKQCRKTALLYVKAQLAEARKAVAVCEAILASK